MLEIITDYLINSCKDKFIQPSIDRLAFLNKFLEHPMRIGSITPSSSFLARKITEQIPWESAETIVELGAGTGVFTKIINKKKTDHSKVIIFEKDYQMRKRLKEIYPQFNFSLGAENLDSVLQQLDISDVDCIISGLPFACFSQSLRDKILNNVINSLKPGGLFVVFQYSLQMRETFVKNFSKVKINLVPLNIPPAFVYHCVK